MRLSILVLASALAVPSVASAQGVPLDKAGFTEPVSALLRKEVGDAAVVVNGPLTLGLGDLQAHLDRRFAYCQRERGACNPEVHQYVKGSAEVHEDRTTPLMDVAKVAGAGQIGQIVGDTCDPGRVLLHDTWAPLVRAQGGTLIVAWPATDALFYIGEDTPIATGALRALVTSAPSRAPNRLSDALLRWTGSGWVPVR